MAHFPENLKPLIRCPVCQKRYDPAKVVLLSEDDRKTALHIACESCGISSLVFLSLGKAGAVSFGMLTDLDRDEVRSFYGREPISADDEISAYRFFREFRGGASECFREIR
ncbi:MAG: hypothetical protein HGA38_04240 [Candidatus Moranbacteria bacterium]|nr:hypothetical protein [Candidatus Moranbacteria bacterium]NTW45827.1 hypothetical protein [Candidatus Moranbacteria bacterium]